MNVFTMVTSSEDVRCARLLVESIRAFGGAHAGSPVTMLRHPSCDGVELPSVETLLLDADPAEPGYFFALKVEACAQAERILADDLATGRVVDPTLVWMSPHCLVVNPPGLLELGGRERAALRTVHVSNVGSPADAPPDEYWQRIYRETGGEPGEHTVVSLVDRVKLRPYFNTHLFSVDTRLGLMARWKDSFDALVLDADFQKRDCSSETRRVFLHQAVLCALLTGALDWGEIRELPVGYSYPLHLHDKVPPEDRPSHLGELTCPVYEESFRYPRTLGGLEVREPLASWLVERTHER